ncbi:DUF72 domain-containing protein [Pseudomonas sp. NA13]
MVFPAGATRLGGDFYPKGLTQKRELQFASRAVNSIEINGSFYALQRPERYAQWYAETPPGFVFSVKAPRFITHIKRLRDIRKPLANFFASGVLELKEKLGAILWQFPQASNSTPNCSKTSSSNCPTTPKAPPPWPANTSHAWTATPAPRLTKRPLRHAVEIRHDSFIDPHFVTLLKRYDVALVIADTAGKWPYREDVTSDFVYLRLHGAEQLYASGYTDEALKRWGERIEAWSHGKQPADAHLIDPDKSPGHAKAGKCSAISTTTSKSARPMTHVTCWSAFIWTRTSPPRPASARPKGYCHEPPANRRNNSRADPATAPGSRPGQPLHRADGQHPQGFHRPEPALHPAGTARSGAQCVRRCGVLAGSPRHP